MSNSVSNMDDVIDLRSVIARVEELESELADEKGNVPTVENVEENDERMPEIEEYQHLVDFLEECKGNGGDEQWNGDWYPITAIRESYFEEYAQEFAEDIGAINKDSTWPNNCIDWEKAARELQYDYTGVDFNGITYYIR